jgi:hypothetical protein
MRQPSHLRFILPQQFLHAIRSLVLNVSDYSGLFAGKSADLSSCRSSILLKYKRAAVITAAANYEL